MTSGRTRKERKPGDARQAIFELSQKLNNASGHNIAALAKVAGISRTSLLAMMKSGKMWLSDQEKLQKKEDGPLDFEVDWPQWRDPHAKASTPRVERADTWENFTGRLNGRPPLKVDPGVTKCLDRSFANFLIAPYIARAKNYADDEFVWGDQIHSKAVDVGGGIWVGLARFHLYFELPERSGVYLRECMAKTRDGIDIKPDGTDHAPDIVYSASKPPIDGRSSATEPLGRYTGAKAGDQIMASMCAHVDDCFVDAKGANLTVPIKRKKVRDHLAKLQALGALPARTDGRSEPGARVTLARQILTVEDNRERE